VSRLRRLASLLEEPLLVAGPPYVLGGQANVRYLTGLQSSNSAVLVEPDGSATLYTDFRYANRARSLDGFDVTEVARGLIPAIGELPERQREVLVLRDLAGLGPEEVCVALGLTDGNQRVLLHRARGKVRRVLEAHLGEAAPA